MLKPKHSAFYATPLELLLEYMEVRNVIIAGITTNACVTITAVELHVRDYGVFVPSDCVAPLSEAEQRDAPKLMQSNFGANTAVSGRLDFGALLK